MAMTTDAADDADATPSVNDYINLANYAYTSGKAPSAFPTQIDYQPLTYNGHLVYRIDTADGFYGQAFISTGTATPNVIVAFEGTNLAHKPPSAKFTYEQVLDDKSIFEGKNPQSYYTALKFTLTAMRDAEAQNVSATNIYVDGHSLGGAEAEYVATNLDLGGATFGAPGIPSADVVYNDPSKLTNFVDYGDPVGNYSADPPRALGSVVQRNSIVHYGTEQYVGTESNGGLLTKIASEYSKGFLGKVAAAADFAKGFKDYHLLTNYAKDLSHQYQTHLYEDDSSTGSDIGFFVPLLGSLAIARAIGSNKAVGSTKSFGATESPGDIACFASGTHIGTTRGSVAVEMLSMDDWVITASGERRRIRWLGHRSIDCRRHPRPQDVWPVRVAAHAFGPDKPARDLFVSPAHAICVDVGGEILLPAAALVDGTGIEQIEVDAVTYWHVELESHDILLAENLPTESYLEMGNRTFFVEAGAIALHGVPDAPQRSHADFCRPMVVGGPIVDAVRARLGRIALRAERAEQAA